MAAAHENTDAGKLPEAFQWRGETTFVLDGVYFLEAFLLNPEELVRDLSKTTLSSIWTIARELKSKCDALEQKLCTTSSGTVQGAGPEEVPRLGVDSDIQELSKHLDSLNALIGFSQAAQGLRRHLEEIKQRFPSMACSVSAEEYVAELAEKAMVLWAWAWTYIHPDSPADMSTNEASASSVPADLLKRIEVTEKVTFEALLHRPSSEEASHGIQSLMSEDWRVEESGKEGFGGPKGGSFARASRKRERSEFHSSPDLFSAPITRVRMEEKHIVSEVQPHVGWAESQVHFEDESSTDVVTGSNIVSTAPPPPPAAKPRPLTRERGYFKVPVFYATDRAEDASKSQSGAKHYGPERKPWSTKNRTNQLAYGVAYVSMPEKREPGKIPGPGRFFKASPDAHVLILSTESFKDGDEFDDVLKATICATANKLPKGDGLLAHSVLLYVHGYNNTFEDAIRRAAQLKWDLDFDGPVVAYSWPSAEHARCYPVDEATIDWTSGHFQRFLEQLLKVQADVQSTYGGQALVEAWVHVVGHSMGNRLVMQALDSLVQDRDHHKTQLPVALGHVITAAPDVDAEYFHGVAVAFSSPSPVAEHVESRSEPSRAMITLYASEHDAPLQKSWLLHAYARAGRCLRTKFMLVDDGFDTVLAPYAKFLARNVNFDFAYGHSDAFEKLAMLQDIRLTLRTSIPVRGGSASLARNNGRIAADHNCGRCPFVGRFYELVTTS